MKNEGEINQEEVFFIIYMLYNFFSGTCLFVCGRRGFDPWVGKIPWRRAWQPIQYSCLENPHGQRSLAG